MTSAYPPIDDSKVAPTGGAAEIVLRRADALQQTLAENFRDELVTAIYNDAEAIARRAVRQSDGTSWNFDQKIDRVVTSRLLGPPVMLGLLSLVFWITITGANYPSQMLADGLFWFEARASAAFDAWGAPWWLTGVIWHGTYRGLAWVIAVMLPPMAIFFPCFTIMEDLGYLPRVAFNLDRLFKKAGAHGRQSLTMSMGLGCNAAGVTACRIIDSPRERLIAILTNNFVPCNGRFPTLILLASVFVAAQFPSAFASVAAAGTVVMVVVIGVLFTLIVSAMLSRTVLKGEASAFTLELPPYRRPNIPRVLYTSLIDRTIFVLWRAIIVAAPAGFVIWIMGNVHVSGVPLSQLVADFIDPLGVAIGLDGVILLAYIVAIPANEIVVPTMLMVYMGGSMMTEDVTEGGLRTLLVDQNGWTLLTAVNLMLFSLLHNPCATTILTMWKETRSLKWTTLGALMPLAIAFLVTFAVATIVRLAGLV
ncbi:MAG: nucleoside recognition domain-containing protein [Planctomycetota bacterium]|jgi:ferrous iron transport protein B